MASGTPHEVLTPELLAEVFGVRAAVVRHPLTGDPLTAFDHRSPAGAVAGNAPSCDPTGGALGGKG